MKIVYCFSLGMKLFAKILPIKKKRVLFTSFNGHYSDSPKCISQKMHELAPHLEQVWLVKKQHINNLPSYVKGIDIDASAKAFWYRATAHIVVDNVYGNKEANLTSGTKEKLRFFLLTFLNKKRGQHIFTTWHGTPLKKMGRDQIGLNILDFSCPQTTMILGNRFTLDIMKHLTFDKINMELLGTPRNDLLFCDEGYKKRIKEALGLPLDKKIILFAPTFRSDDSGTMNTNILRSGINQLNEIDFPVLFKALSKAFGGEWAMICRFHYHVEAKVDWQSLQKDCPDIINGNINDNMAEYLACADVLLTDASSAMFDFALSKKPCFLFFPDLDYYENKERGFYMPVSELPFKVAKDFSNLINCISEFNNEEYIEQIDMLLDKIGCIDDEKSSARVSKYIIEKGFA